MPSGTTALSALLAWLVSGPGAGIASYFLMEKIPRLTYLSSEQKRYVSLALAAALSMAAFSVAVGLKYETMPIGVQGWVESLFAVSFVASGLSQVIHGRAKLRQR